MKTLLLLILLLLPLSHASAEWIYLTSNKSGDKVFFDPERLDRDSDGTVYAWMKAEFKQNILFGSKYAELMVDRVAFDCTLNRYMFLRVTPHYTDGTRDTFTYADNRWVQIAPDSNFAPISRAVCVFREP